MTANDRVRKVRTVLGLSQAKFAKKILISGGYLAEIELGGRKVNARIAKLISTTFNVSEEWLMNGEGDMFIPASETEQLVKKFGFSDMVSAMLESFESLNENQQEAVLLYTRKVVSALLNPHMENRELTYEEITRYGIETSKEATRKMEEQEREKKEMGSA